MSTVPLVIDVMDKGQSTFDKRIGTVTINLNELRSAPKSSTYGGTLQVLDAWHRISVLEDAEVQVGLVRVIVTLEDLGPLPIEQQMAQQAPIEESARREIERQLQQWLRAEKQKWRAKLKKKEEIFMAERAKEWQTRLLQQEEQTNKRHR